MRTLLILLVAFCLTIQSSVANEVSWKEDLREGAKLVKKAEFVKAIPILERGLKSAEKTGDSLSDCWLLYYWLGDAYGFSGNLRQAEATFRKGISVVRDGTIDQALLLAALSECLQGQQRDEESSTVRKQALSITDKEKDHTKTANILIRLAKSCQMANKYAEAETLFKRVVEQDRKNASSNSPLDISIDYLGSLYLLQNRLQEAELLFQESLALKEKKFGTQSAEVAHLLVNLAELKSKQGKLPDCESLSNRALKIMDRLPEDSFILTIVQGLAWCLKSQKRYDEAEVQFKRHMLLREKYYGKDDLFGKRSLAIFLQSRSKDADAEPLLQQCVEAAERRFGADSLETADALDDLSNARYYRGRYSEAERLCKRSIAIRDKLGPESSGRATERLVRIGIAQSRFQEAEALARRWVSLDENRFGAESSKLIDSLKALATVLDHLAKFNEVEGILRRCLLIREKSLGTDHKDLAGDLSKLGAALKKRGNLDEAETMYKRCLAVCEKNFGTDDFKVCNAVDDLAQLEDFRGRYDSAESLYKRVLAIREKDGDARFRIISMNKLGLFYEQRGKYAKAEDVLREALAVCEKEIGHDRTYMPLCLKCLALHLRNRGNYNEAEALYRRLARLKESILGPDHIDVARALQGIADVLAVRGKYSEAQKILDRAIRICEKSLGPDHLDVADLLQSQALLCRTLGSFSDAETKAKRSLDIRTKVFGDKHEEVANTLFWLGEHYEYTGNFRLAESYHLRALKIRETIFGSEHPTLAISQNRMAELLTKLGRYSDAETFFKKAIEVRQNKIGNSEHQDLAYTLVPLAELRRLEGRIAEAESLLGQALRLQEKARGEEHIDLVTTLDSLAKLLKGQLRYSEAEQVCRRALEIRIKHLGTEHKDVAGATTNLASILVLMGRNAEAESLFRSALSVREKTLGRNHPDVAQVLNDLGLLLEKSSRFADAESLYQRASKIYDTANGSAHPFLATPLCNLANVYKQQGRLVESEALYKQGIGIIQKAYGEEHPEFTKHLGWLGYLYLKQGRFADSETLFRQVFQLNKSRLGVRRESDPFARNAQVQRFAIVSDLRSNGSSTPENDTEIKILDALEKQGHMPNDIQMKAFQDLMNARRAKFGEDDPQVSEALMQIAVAFSTLGVGSRELTVKAYDKFSTFAKQAILNTDNPKPALKESLQRIGGPDHASMFSARVLLCFGNLLAAQTEDSKAREAFELSETCVYKQSVDSKIPILLDLNQSWQLLGEFPKAAQLLGAAKEISKDSPADLAKCLLAEAKLYLEQANYAETLSKAKAALSCGAAYSKDKKFLYSCYITMAEAADGMNQPFEVSSYVGKASKIEGLGEKELALCLLLQGNALADLREFESARDAFQSVLDLSGVEGMAAEQQLFTTAAASLGMVLEKLQKHEEARRQFSWALSFDDENPSSTGLLATARDYNGLALTERSLSGTKSGSSDRARHYVLSASEKIDKYIKTAFHGLSIGQQCAFVSIAKQQRDSLLSVCQERHSIGVAYGFMMKWKGLLLESIRSKRAIGIAVVKNPKLADIEKSLNEKIRTLSSYANKRNRESDDGSIRDLYQIATDERENLERQLSLASGIKLEDPLEKLGVEGFRNLLKEGEAFVDIVLYKPLLEEDEYYAAIAVKSSSKETAFFQLGRKKDIDRTISKWRFAVTGDASELERDIILITNTKKSREKVNAKEFANVTQALSDLTITNSGLKDFLGTETNTLWVCPEGAIAQVPWDAVRLILGVSNLRRIATVDSPRAFAFLRSETKKETISSPSVMLAAIGNFGKANLNSLPGTIKEVQQIKSLAENYRHEVAYLLEQSATKDNVKTKLCEATHAHIATHGFAAAEDQEPQPKESSTRSVVRFQRSSGGAQLAVARNPFLECGLYLASPEMNVAYDESSSILTADEIIGSDLSKCDIVVLSACQTGLGRRVSGQGVLGLRSAIIGAGAKSVIMSLWSVPDEATQVLMKQLYVNLWEKKLPEQIALAEAQEFVRSQSKWKSPKNWAGWIVVGE